MQRGIQLTYAIWGNMRAKTLCRAGTATLMALALLGLAVTKPAFAQEPPQRQIRAFIPPDQIVSFLPTTTFETFLDNLNPIFVQVTGKRVIDPENRSFNIQTSIVGMQFFDAFELVLDTHGLTYRETDRYFLIEVAPEEPEITGVEGPGQRRSRRGDDEATAKSREIEIEAIMYEINHSQSNELGIDWAVFLGAQGTQGGGGGRNDFFIKTDDIFDSANDWLDSPDRLNARIVNSFFRIAEQRGLGKTIASPKVTVRSGEQGRIQIGSDVPIQVRDFAGNTITQFVATGVIVDVTPTLISSPVADTVGSPVLDFIHLDIKVERSQSRPSFGGIAIDRSTADTDVLLLNNEMTVIGGLYQTDETTDRSGVPILKDLPWWVFGLKYIFGKETKVQTKRELLVVIKARVIDSLTERAESPFADDFHMRSREQVLDILRRFDPRITAEWPKELTPGMLDKDAKTESGGDQ